MLSLTYFVNSAKGLGTHYAFLQLGAGNKVPTHTIYTFFLHLGVRERKKQNTSQLPGLDRK